MTDNLYFARQRRVAATLLCFLIAAVMLGYYAATPYQGGELVTTISRTITENVYAPSNGAQLAGALIGGVVFGLAGLFSAFGD